MNNRRRIVLALGAGALGALGAPLASFSQQQGKIWRIGFLGTTSASNFASRVEAFRAGLRDLGYVEGRNIAIVFRWADGKYDRLPELAAELVHLKVDVIVTAGTPGVRAAKQATTTIPIVMTGSGDPVATGLVDSLAHPGGNVTGSAFFSPEINAKRLELLKKVMPRTTRVAVLVNPVNSVFVTDLKEMEAAARSMNMELHQFEARAPSEFESVFAAMVKRRIGAIAILDDAMLIANAKAIADLAAMRRLSSIGFHEFVEAGGLLGYGPSRLERNRRAAYFVDRILKGARPGDLPIEQASKFELHVNLKTARALGLTLPRSILVRADRIIE